jgi:hypothetical protein
MEKKSKKRKKTSTPAWGKRGGTARKAKVVKSPQPDYLEHAHEGLAKAYSRFRESVGVMNLEPEIALQRTIILTRTEILFDMLEAMKPSEAIKEMLDEKTPDQRRERLKEICASIARESLLVDAEMRTLAKLAGTARSIELSSHSIPAAKARAYTELVMDKYFEAVRSVVEDGAVADKVDDYFLELLTQDREHLEDIIADIKARRVRNALPPGGNDDVTEKTRKP